MEQTITFRVELETKEKIRKRAEVVGLGMAPFCRHTILRELLKEESTE